jgi:hypothetical protein
MMGLLRSQDFEQFIFRIFQKHWLTFRAETRNIALCAAFPAVVCHTHQLDVLRHAYYTPGGQWIFGGRERESVNPFFVAAEDTADKNTSDIQTIDKSRVR